MIKPWLGITNPFYIAFSQSQAVHMVSILCNELKSVSKEFLKFIYLELFMLKVISTVSQLTVILIILYSIHIHLVEIRIHINVSSD